MKKEEEESIRDLLLPYIDITSQRGLIRSKESKNNSGPALGPLMAGFAVSANNWRWSLWEIVWMAAPMLILLLILMPETSASNILLRRAQRLRLLTGNASIQSQSEIDQRHLKASAILISALIKPIENTIKDPAILFVNIYTALFYGIYYTFFEVFPLVFPPMYGFNLGEIGLAFTSCLLGATPALLIHFAYLHFYMIPDNIAHGLRAQEHRLVPAIFGSFLLPTGLFIFGWTANSSIHWVVSLIGVVVFVIGTFLILQSIFVYVPLSYPQYAASLFAGNDLVRSSMAAGSILFARPLFVNLGVAKGGECACGVEHAGHLWHAGYLAYGCEVEG
jgi:MFS transporter, DHA1 family, multidrug resistance protein